MKKNHIATILILLFLGFGNHVLAFDATPALQNSFLLHEIESKNTFLESLHRHHYKKSFTSRVASTVALVYVQKAYGVRQHEFAHALTIEKNGGVIESIESGLRGKVDFSNLCLNKFMVDAAGLARQNQVAGKEVKKHIGKNFNISDLVRFLINQRSLPKDIFFHSQKPQYYKKGSSDINNYIAALTDDAYKQNRLYKDLKVGAAWQSLGLIAPAIYSCDYLLNGDNTALPNLWLNPQTEMTDAGALYTLDLWGRSGDVVYTLRVGYGNDRVQGDKSYQFEVGCEQLQLSSDCKFDFRIGYSDTLDPSLNCSAELKRTFWDFVSVKGYAEYFSGYHRDNSVNRNNIRTGAILQCAL